MSTKRALLATVVAAVATLPAAEAATGQQRAKVKVMGAEEAVIERDGVDYRIRYDGGIPVGSEAYVTAMGKRGGEPWSLAGDPAAASVECGDKVTGGGFITTTPSRKKANFGFVFRQIGSSGSSSLNYVDSNYNGGMHLKSVTITSYQIVNTTTRRILGTATINGAGGYTFDVTVSDKGEPGRKDVFTIAVSNGYKAGKGTLGGGNIQLHRSGTGCDSPVRFSLVLCAERTETTNTENTPPSSQADEGSIFPWSNDASFFATYRNQYLYPSSSLQALRDRGITTIESVHSRAVSFSSVSENVYGAGSYVGVTRTARPTLSTTFNENYRWPDASTIGYGTRYLNRTGAMTITHSPGSLWGGNNTELSALSDCTTCRSGVPASRNDLDVRVDLPNPVPADLNLLVDTLLYLNGGNNVTAVWDTTPGLDGCEEGPLRAYGSSTFVNTNNLTTAFGVDNKAFVWVFRGQSLALIPSFATQVGETVELLVGERVRRELKGTPVP